MLFLVRIFAAAIWAILGLFLWIPMIVRAFAIQSAALVYSALADTDAKLSDESLTRILQFYPKGFERIFADNPGKREKGEWKDALFRAVFEIFFSFTFYLMTLLTYLAIFTDELDFGAADVVPILATKGPEVTVEYPNAVVTDNFYYNSIFGGSKEAQAEIRILRVIAPSKSATRVSLYFRVCNVGQYRLLSRINIHYTDVAQQSFHWNEFDPGKIDPGACTDGRMTSSKDRPWNEVNFRQGAFYLSFGAITATMRVRL